MGKAQIKILIIGKDGIARKFWVDHDAEFYDNKYKIDQDAVYQTSEGGFLGFGTRSQATILFRENNVMAISFKVKPSTPDPDEMGASISRAAWAIAELMRKKNEQMMQIMMALMAIACIIAGASAFFAYSAGSKIDKLQTTVDSLSSRITSANLVQNTTILNPSGTIPVIPGTVITAKPTNTQVPLSNQVPTV